MKKEMLQAFRFTSKSCTLMSPTKTELVSKTGGKQNAPEKESKGTKMIAHAVGDFTPPAGKNADTVRHYDVHLHRKDTIPYCGSIGFML